MLPRHRISLWQCSSQQYKGQVILHQIQQGLLRSYCLLVVFCQAPGICRWNNHCLHKVPLIYHFWEVLQSQLPQHKVRGSLQQVAVSHTRSCHCCNFFKDTPLCNHWIKKGFSPHNPSQVHVPITSTALLRSPKLEHTIH